MGEDEEVFAIHNCCFRRKSLRLILCSCIRTLSGEMLFRVLLLGCAIYRIRHPKLVQTGSIGSHKEMLLSCGWTATFIKSSALRPVEGLIWVFLSLQKLFSYITFALLMCWDAHLPPFTTNNFSPVKVMPRIFWAGHWFSIQSLICICLELVRNNSQFTARPPIKIIFCHILCLMIPNFYGAHFERLVKLMYVICAISYQDFFPDTFKALIAMAESKPLQVLLSSRLYSLLLRKTSSSGGKTLETTWPGQSTWLMPIFIIHKIAIVCIRLQTLSSVNA